MTPQCTCEVLVGEADAGYAADFGRLKSRGLELDDLSPLPDFLNEFGVSERGSRLSAANSA